MSKITFRGEYATAIQFAVSTEETRYYLNGFYVHAAPNGKGLSLVATDGHRMAVFHDVLGTIEGGGLIIKLPKDALSVINKQKKLGSFVVIEGDHTSATATVHESNAAATPLSSYNGVSIDGTFPDYRRSVPHTYVSSAPVTSFSAEDLGAFKAACRNKNAQITLQPSSDDGRGPWLVCTDRDDFFGVLMPIRSINKGLPAFWAAARPV